MLTTHRTNDEIALAQEALRGVDVPESIRDNLVLFLRLVRRVLDEYDHDLRVTFDELLTYSVAAKADNLSPKDREQAFLDAAALVDDLPVERMTMVTRAFAAYFHLANICEESYRVSKLRERESTVPTNEDADPVNDIVRAYRRLVEECGPNKARVLLSRLEFHPVFTAHPTEARRKAVEGKIRRIAGPF